jgi:hypothetical protein
MLSPLTKNRPKAYTVAMQSKSAENARRFLRDRGNSAAIHVALAGGSEP